MKSGLHKLREFAACARALGRTPREKWEISWRQTKNLRVRLGLTHYVPERIFKQGTRYGPVYLRDNFGDVTNLPGLFHRNIYNCGALRGEGVILDVGANIGLFAAWASRQNPGREVHCIEPLESNVRLITKNCPAAIVHHCAAGQERGHVRLGVDAQRVMASAVANPRSACVEEFEAVQLDEVVRAQGIQRVAFLKMDIEGMEIDALEGGRETLAITQRVAMETHGQELHRKALRLLGEAGLVVEEERFTGKTGMIFAARPEAKNN